MSEIPLCPECGSIAVVRDALSEWNPTMKDWALVTVLDSFSCNECGADDIDPEWKDPDAIDEADAA
ncbi:MAG: hypothetical protein L0H37_09810 [Nitrosospira sp.]|nr:hypothetical protein [Nitrosospira sp.]